MENVICYANNVEIFWVNFVIEMGFAVGKCPVFYTCLVLDLGDFSLLATWLRDYYYYLTFLN